MAKTFKEYPGGNIVTKHFDIFDNGVILDLITPDGAYYIEFNSKHQCTEFTKWI